MESPTSVFLIILFPYMACYSDLRFGKEECIRAAG
jgi:hypothetical protein